MPSVVHLSGAKGTQRRRVIPHTPSVVHLSGAKERQRSRHNRRRSRHNRRSPRQGSKCLAGKRHERLWPRRCTSHESLFVPGRHVPCARTPRRISTKDLIIREDPMAADSATRSLAPLLNTRKSFGRAVPEERLDAVGNPSASSASKFRCEGVPPPRHCHHNAAL